MAPRSLAALLLALALSACETRCDVPPEPAEQPAADPLPTYPEPRDVTAQPARPSEPTVEILPRDTLLNYLTGMGIEPPRGFMVPDAVWIIPGRVLMLATPNRHGPYTIVEYGDGQLVVAWRDRDLNT